MLITSLLLLCGCVRCLWMNCWNANGIWITRCQIVMYLPFPPSIIALHLNLVNIYPRERCEWKFNFVPIHIILRLQLYNELTQCDWIIELATTPAPIFLVCHFRSNVGVGMKLAAELYVEPRNWGSMNEISNQQKKNNVTMFWCQLKIRWKALMWRLDL